MALWTPYADDAALDLSKSSKEDQSPESPVDPYHFGCDMPPLFPPPLGTMALYPPPLGTMPLYPPPHGTTPLFPLSATNMPHMSPPAAPMPYCSPSEAPMPYFSPSEAPTPYFSPAAVPMPQFSPLPAAVPASHPSPLSGASLSSYERPFSPQYPHESAMTPHYRVQTLSPPISPESQKRDWMDDSLSDDPDFQKFEKDALRAMAEKNGGVLLGNNPRMRRTVCSNNGSKDDSYRKQRERNNFAAKQSRDRRKLREIHLALKVTYLKKEVAALKASLASKVCNRCHQSCRC